MAIEMPNVEISRRLALAIGYRPQDVLVRVGSLVAVQHNGWYRPFDHRDERTVFRIAARYGMFPQWDANRQCWLVQRRLLSTWSADAITCIALAVIEASERGLLS